jgi:hypothetical protein
VSPHSEVFDVIAKHLRCVLATMTVEAGLCERIRTVVIDVDKVDRVFQDDLAVRSSGWCTRKLGYCTYGVDVCKEQRLGEVSGSRPGRARADNEERFRFPAWSSDDFKCRTRWVVT